MILDTPSEWRAQMFALLLTLCGGIVWSLPWRGMKATDLPLYSPIVIRSEVLPYGVKILIDFALSSNSAL